MVYTESTKNFVRLVKYVYMESAMAAVLKRNKTTLTDRKILCAFRLNLGLQDRLRTHADKKSMTMTGVIEDWIRRLTTKKKEED